MMAYAIISQCITPLSSSCWWCLCNNEKWI